MDVKNFHFEYKYLLTNYFQYEIIGFAEGLIYRGEETAMEKSVNKTGELLFKTLFMQYLRSIKQISLSGKEIQTKSYGENHSTSSAFPKGRRK